MKYLVQHRTQIRYQSPVRLARFNVRLDPLPWPGQAIEDFVLSVEPKPSLCQQRPGPYPFHITRIAIDEPIRALEISTRFTATAQQPTLDLVSPDHAIADVARAALRRNDLGSWGPAHYVYPSPLLPGISEIGEWARRTLLPEAPVFASALALAQSIQRDFQYDTEATDAETPVDVAFAMRRGVCQDFAHILIEGLRSVGVPAAYVSGYLRTKPPPGKPRLIGADAMHAWAALWCGVQRGWVGIDPTNGCVAGSAHIAIGAGRDYSDVSPVDGVFIGGRSQWVETSVDVEPIEE